MKIPVNNVIAVWEFLNGFLGQYRPIPAAGVARFISWHRTLLPIYQTHKAEWSAVFKQFAQLSGDGKVWSLPEDKVEAFNEAWGPKGEKEIDIPLKRIKVNDLFFNSGYTGGITQAEMLILGPLIKD